MPDFTLRDTQGGELRFKDLAGKPVLINLWATWCAPCVAELPALDRLAGDEAARLKVIAVSQDMGAPDKVGAFLGQRGITRLGTWLDPANDLAVHYGAQTLPTTIYYDAQGREVWRISGARDWTSAETRKALALP